MSMAIRIKTLLAALIALTLLPMSSFGDRQQAAEVILIHAGQLLAVPGEPPLDAQTIIVRGDRIEEIRAGYVEPGSVELEEDESARLIDLRGSFVLPGLMDAHVHLMWSGGDRPPKKADDMTQEDLTLWALRNSRAMLGAGFTTVREVASSPEVIFAVRDWIDGGKYLGPRILAAGIPVSADGGHGDTTAPDVDPGDLSASGLCSGLESCRRAVRVQHKRGADLIKMMSTGGFSDNTGTEQLFFFDEMQATVDAAHQLGMTVATHAYAGDAIDDAVRAGVDSVDHGFGARDDTLRRMKKENIYLVPTLSIAQRKGSPIKALRERDRAFERALDIDAPIAFGTDVGGIPHRFAAKEFTYMVEAGMGPAAAIVAATVNTAKLFRLEEDVGTLEAGKLADIIAVTGEPLREVSVLEKVDFVMKSGKVAKSEGKLADFFLD